ncbi:ARF GTPase activator [Histoplasma capsulatum var. duboisii H88]|uniref:ADP-ribosylation factor GTPase-activating protein n=2 Tax=Ajellomyces capsulatus TaxID=5037 RepID=F0UW63_AJEC8|nr:csx2 protein [Histoplasma capsulatum H143]EGC42573.1 ARF GTPase activator [Histoplasma capsulatum var. duboisii H88]QSS57386.1 ARF GTPase activator [Histoplasma capsulatum var. duboisii H88]
MGNISSRPDEPGSLYLKDQTKLAIASVIVTNSRGNLLLTIAPNQFPSTRIIPRRESGDDRPVEYIQDPESPSTGLPSFLLKLCNDDELNFRFTFFLRQGQTKQPAPLTTNGVATCLPEAIDTVLTGLTFAHASNPRDLDNLVTREFHANPNLQNNSNVKHVGNFSTSGSPSIQFDWSWKWKPPRQAEDRCGGWRNCCSFLDYDQRTNRLNTLATFSFWVQNVSRPSSSPQIPSPRFDLTVPPRHRVPSSQSVQSRISDTEAINDLLPPPTPPEFGDNLPTPHPLPAQSSVKLDVTCQRPGEDMSAVEDGPLFRATMKALEQKTGNMRAKMKKVLKKAEAAHQAQIACNDAVSAFITALNDASLSNANAIQPALEHYFDRIAREILNYEQQNTVHLQKLIIDPLSKLYNHDIKQAESKKKDFEEESRDYYAYVGRYLGQRQDSLKEKKRAESDSKYQTKRRNFELKRFDYSSFMQDLHGGRKEQEVLSHLTKYADTQAKSYLAAAKKIEEMIPQLQALIDEVSEADKEFQFQRTEREEKRRALETSTKKYIEPGSVPTSGVTALAPGNSNFSHQSDSELGRADSTGSQLKAVATNNSAHSSSLNPPIHIEPPTGSLSALSGSNRFKGIRDLEDRDSSSPMHDMQEAQHRKEGLLWALSRPGSHIDPKGINKQAWHKFWIVLDQGKLSEYSNWKQKLDLHMEPIDLRMASVREARNAERRFCFEVITPQYKRIYQATSEEDMNAWIIAINNALQSAVEGRSLPPVTLQQPITDGAIRRGIGSVLAGKGSHSSQQAHYNPPVSGVNRRTTVGARPCYVRGDNNNYEENPSKLLQTVRDADQGNCWCADCGSLSKVEWVSINLGIVLCIECSGIHRSLGTHISKIRSLTLDIHSFSNDIVEILLQVGNRVSNMVWESRLDPSLKPTAQSTREQRLKFITAKYSERAYLQPLSATLSRYATAEETLLASIKRNDIQGVLYGIALRANLNVTDRSRGTHAVFLALAAADPAFPASSGQATAIPSRSAAVPPSAEKHIPFPIAELLVQNGAEIPSEMPSIPLSPAAQLYINQRTAKISGSFIVQPRALASSMGDPGTDITCALPLIHNSGKPSSNGENISTTSPASHPLTGLDNKERERLQKRGSAGARFAGKVASLGSDR